MTYTEFHEQYPEAQEQAKRKIQIAINNIKGALKSLEVMDGGAESYQAADEVKKVYEIAGDLFNAVRSIVSKTANQPWID